MTTVPHRTLEQLDADVHEARRVAELHSHACATLLATGEECERCVDLQLDVDAAVRRADAARSQAGVAAADEYARRRDELADKGRLR